MISNYNLIDHQLYPHPYLYTYPYILPSTSPTTVSPNHPQPVSNIFKKTCYKCGNLGHFAENCKHSTRLCYNCKKPGHESSVCTESRDGNLKQCYYCKKMGHVQADCKLVNVNRTNNGASTSHNANGNSMHALEYDFNSFHISQGYNNGVKQQKQTKKASQSQNQMNQQQVKQNNKDYYPMPEFPVDYNQIYYYVSPTAKYNELDNNLITNGEDKQVSKSIALPDHKSASSNSASSNVLNGNNSTKDDCCNDCSPYYYNSSFYNLPQPIPMSSPTQVTQGYKFNYNSNPAPMNLNGNNYTYSNYGSTEYKGNSRYTNTASSNTTKKGTK